jgi:hypothetical protein
MFAHIDTEIGLTMTAVGSPVQQRAGTQPSPNKKHRRAGRFRNEPSPKGVIR